MIMALFNGVRRRMVWMLVFLWCSVSFAAFNQGGHLLAPEQAFELHERMVTERDVELTFDIAPGYYLYRDRFKFEVESPQNVHLGEVSLPQAQIKEDPNFGTMAVYHEQVVIKLPLPAKAIQPLVLKVVWQGCAEQGVCYPPLTRQVHLKGLPALSEPVLKPIPAVVLAPTEEQQFANRLLGEKTVWVLLAFFGAGLVLAFSPCLLPLAPILYGIVIGNADISRRRGFLLALTYVLGMSVAYAVAGVMAALSGSWIVVALQKPWVLGVFAGLFVVFALALFDVIHLQIPGRWHNRLHVGMRRLKGGRFPAVMAMGMLSALIVGPCVAPPLMGGLLYISQTGHVLMGALALWVMALGMGVPLLVLGTVGGALLPKAGVWMNTVRRLSALAMLAVAVYMVRPLWPDVWSNSAWAVLCFWAAAMIARTWLKHFRVTLRSVLASVMVLGLVALAVFLLWPKSSEQHRIGEVKALEFDRVSSAVVLEGSVLASRTWTMVDVYADWCTACKRLERETFADGQVSAQLKKLRRLKVDVTHNGVDDAALLKKWGIYGPPALLFFDEQGREIPQMRVIGFKSAHDFMTVLQPVVAR